MGRRRPGRRWRDRYGCGPSDSKTARCVARSAARAVADSARCRRYRRTIRAFSISVSPSAISRRLGMPKSACSMVNMRSALLTRPCSARKADRRSERLTGLLGVSSGTPSTSPNVGWRQEPRLLSRDSTSPPSGFPWGTASLALAATGPQVAFLPNSGRNATIGPHRICD